MFLELTEITSSNEVGILKTEKIIINTEYIITVSEYKYTNIILKNNSIRVVESFDFIKNILIKTN